MKLHKQIDLLTNKKLQVALNLAAIPVFIGSIFVLLPLSNKTTFSFDGFRLLMIMIILIGSLLVHELIHGLFYKLFHPSGHVKYGFKGGMLYATNPGTLYPRWQFMIIGIMPLLLITGILWLLSLVNVLSGPEFVLIAAIHASGCVGDLYLKSVLIFSPIGAVVEDTSNGIDVYIQS
ncbi:DUF3267 domain-containing protein [Lentilactobacillus diolivorans]|uniref:DUF3267 domain-containing protein n=1 Tax=Lentilactobacillus diolivorans TaxID=179838 RepID=UPI00246866F9|nr:DUF3267 domain-containing protein [Lentilactobacillus diolivorans]MDH5105283.1 DUF3267 domain-containing protein [Lentilactobacillus diolivorans]